MTPGWDFERGSPLAPDLFRSFVLSRFRRRQASEARTPSSNTRVEGSGTAGEPPSAVAPQLAARIAASSSLTTPSSLKSPSAQ